MPQQYEFVQQCRNVNPVYSRTIQLWKDIDTSKYFVSSDIPIRKNTFITALTNPKQVTLLDFASGKIEYDGCIWKLNKFHH